LSAHQARHTEAESWGSIIQLGAEYETLTAASLEDRWAALIRASLPEFQAEAVLASEAFGPLTAELHRADAAGWNPETEFPRLVAARSFADTDDVAAVLHGRLNRVLDRLPIVRRGQANYIVGLYPEVTGTASGAMMQALTERKAALESRAAELVHRAIAAHEPWLATLGQRPTDRAGATRWTRAALAIAAYRERYEVTGSDPLGVPTTLVQRRDATRIRALAARPRLQAPESSSTVDRGQAPVL
jgi:hypothetical protein